jgi:hypothetical protein
MEKKNNNGVVDKKNIENLNKYSRIYLFLSEINNKLSSKEIENLYLNKYKLSEKSNKLNIRVVERFLGEYNKYSESEKKEKKELLSNNLIESKSILNYNDLIEKYKIVKEKSKRSNRINSLFLEI